LARCPAALEQQIIHLFPRPHVAFAPDLRYTRSYAAQRVGCQSTASGMEVTDEVLDRAQIRMHSIKAVMVATLGD